MIIVLLITNIILLILQRRTQMAAIDNLNQAVVKLVEAINNLNIPVSNDVSIQQAADNIVSATEALKAKVA